MRDREGRRCVGRQRLLWSVLKVRGMYFKTVILRRGNMPYPSMLWPQCSKILKAVPNFKHIVVPLNIVYQLGWQTCSISIDNN